MTDDINILTLIKSSGERYVFLYDDDHREELLRTIGRFASNSALSFNWYDAANLAQRVRRQGPKQSPQARAARSLFKFFGGKS